MANDERQSDTFIREVDEELRRDQLKALWKRFAPLIIGVCVLIVVITAGYRGWVWWEERKAAQAGDRFMAALAEIESGDRAKGEADLTAIASDSADAGYSALARLRLAGEKAAAGDKPAALAAYDAAAKDVAVPTPLRDIARVRAALLALDTGDLSGASERAMPLNAAGNSWRHVAREIVGTAAYQAGDLQAARDAFTQIQQDAETPQDLWIRSGLMVSLIDGQLAPQETNAGSTTPNSGTAAPPAPVPAPTAGASDAAPNAAPAELPVPSEGETGLPAAGMGDDSSGAGQPAASAPAIAPAPTTIPVPAPDASGASPPTPNP